MTQNEFNEVKKLAKKALILDIVVGVVFFFSISLTGIISAVFLGHVMAEGPSYNSIIALFSLPAFVIIAVLIFIAFLIVIIINLVFYIQLIIKIGDFKPLETAKILLIIGFFVAICALVGLIMILTHNYEVQKINHNFDSDKSEDVHEEN